MIRPRHHGSPDPDKEPIDLTITNILLRLSLGIGIGFCIGMTGVGGGVLVLPALTLVIGLPPSVAVGTASLYACLTKLYASYRHFRLKTIDLPTAAAFLGGALPATVVVAAIVNKYAVIAAASEETSTRFQHGLNLLIGTVILLSAVMLILNFIGTLRRRPDTPKRTLADSISEHPILRRILGVLCGIIVGGLIGSTSIGGGVIIVPLLIILFGLTTRATVGTSIFIAVVLTLVTSIVFSVGAQMDFATAIVMSVGSLAGVHWGSKFAVKLSERVLQGIVTGVILIAAVLMLCGQSGH